MSAEAKATSNEPPFTPADTRRMLQWAIYDHPSDFPNTYVARCWIIEQNGTYGPSTDVIMTTDLDSLRRMMEGMGLVRITRSPDDDPTIIEVWL